MALFDGYLSALPVAVAGMQADGTQARDASSFALDVATTPGVYCTLDSNGDAVAGAAGSGGPAGVLMVDETRLLPFTAGSVQSFMRKGRIWMVLASGATAPANGAPVSVNSSGQVVSTGGTLVPGLFGYTYGSTGTSTASGLCLVEINLPMTEDTTGA